MVGRVAAGVVTKVTLPRLGGLISGLLRELGSAGCDAGVRAASVTVTAVVTVVLRAKGTGWQPFRRPAG